MKKFSIAPTAERDTRDCLDPWFFALFASNRELWPCCWHKPLLTVPVGASLRAALDGPEMREMRRMLLEGELDRECRECPTRPLTSKAQLRERVRIELAMAWAEATDNAP